MADNKSRSWEVSDEFWQLVEPLIPAVKRSPGKKYKRKAGGGRKPLPTRQVFEAIVYVLRTGIQWKALPKEKFGSPSAIHRYFQEWIQKGFFKKLWKKGLAEYDELEGIAWSWQSMDGTYVKSPMGNGDTGRNPTDREKKGSKRHLLVDEHGVPLSIVVTGANKHDTTQFAAVLWHKISNKKDVQQNLCADTGYTGE